MDRALSKILTVSPKAVIPLGRLGCFDQHGIFPMHVVRDNDRILTYTCGWSRRVSVSVETAIGFAQSFDGGATFIKNGAGPIMGPCANEPFLVGDPFVNIVNGTYHMWYIFGVRWVDEPKNLPPDRVYKIAHAVSHDGLTWERTGKTIIPDVIDENECQALPTVMRWRNRYHMYFCFRNVRGFRTEKGLGYRLGYAYSDDLVTWTRDDARSDLALSADPAAWDSEMMCYPHLFAVDDVAYILYNGNRFGRNGFGLARLLD
ncbi:MAG: hypothetical protein AAB263_03405 [Planctomycetota bacterium]